MQFNQNPQTHTETLEKEMYEPKVLPVIDKGEHSLFGEDFYYPEEKEVIEKWSLYNPLSESRAVQYSLASHIAGLEYVFESQGRETNPVRGFLFKTVEYNYARTNLDDKGTQVLFEKVADFLETVYCDMQGSCVGFNIAASDASYTVRDIEDCVEKILQVSQEYSREELLKRYKGVGIFDYYQQLTGRFFSDTRFNNTSRAQARARYFKQQFKKYLKEWEVQDYSFGSMSMFILVRKGVSLKEER
jgi:dGTP triphosphohydrolase